MSADQNENDKKIISYALWGNKPIYTFGMIINALDAPKYFPGWIVRVYYGQSTPDDIIDVLKTFDHVELVPMPENGDRRGMFWRFYPASEPNVAAMLSRDSDSRLSEREAAAVNEWMASDKGFHTMRDNSAHGIAILGGMWGIKKGVIPNMKQMVDEYEKGDFWQVDQNFLTEKITPLVSHLWMEHDPFFARKPFPLPRKGKEFIGEPISNDLHRVIELYPKLSHYLGTIFMLTRGGFGNIFFNYLMGYSLGRRYGMPVSYVPVRTEKRQDLTKYRLFNDLNCQYAAYPHHALKIDETDWTYNRVSIPDIYTNYLLDGYYQSYKHSAPYIDEIRSLLIPKLFRPDVLDWFNKEKRGLKDDSRSVLVHVRRGDYLNLQDYHPVPSDHYYQQAFSHLSVKEKSEGLEQEYKLFVCTDDISFAQSWPLLQRYNHAIVPFTNVEDSFYLMTLCDDFIIANSSLSLLSYYFRANKKGTRLCMPRKWFGPSGPAYKHEDLVELNESVFVIDY